jgi:hypothetical protein
MGPNGMHNFWPILSLVAGRSMEVPVELGYSGI